MVEDSFLPDGCVDLLILSMKLVTSSTSTTILSTMPSVTWRGASRIQKWKVMILETANFMLDVPQISGMSCWRLLSCQMGPKHLQERDLGALQCQTHKQLGVYARFLMQWSPRPYNSSIYITISCGSPRMIGLLGTALLTASWKSSLLSYGQPSVLYLAFCFQALQILILLLVF